MSGGSYNYLCFADSGDIGNHTSDLAQMIDRLRGLGYAPRATAATERVLALLRDEGPLVAAIADLSDVWHAVEWRDSCDWGDDQMRVEIERYEARYESRQEENVTNPAATEPETSTVPSRRRAVIRIHEQLVHDLLQLPPDVVVHHVAPGYMGWTIDVAVTSPDLPECAEGACAPELCPTYARIDDRRAVLVETGIAAVPGAREWEWAYRYPDTGPVYPNPISEEQARRKAAQDLGIVLLRREPGQTEWTEAPA